MVAVPTGFVDRSKSKSRWEQSWSNPQTGITASATVSQAAATPLTSQMCFIATCATAGNAVKLPTAVPGMEIAVINQTANAAATYPMGATDTINGGSAGASVALPTGTGGATPVVIFYCGVAGAWWSK